jgi:DNA-binding ferritin-like protein
MIELLNARLADTIDLRLQTKQAHWNVKGPNFVALHAVRKAIEIAANAGDEDTIDIFTDVSRGLDKALWLFEAHNAVST